MAALSPLEDLATTVAPVIMEVLVTMEDPEEIMVAPEVLAIMVALAVAARLLLLPPSSPPEVLLTRSASLPVSSAPSGLPQSLFKWLTSLPIMDDHLYLLLVYRNS